MLYFEQVEAAIAQTKVEVEEHIAASAEMEAARTALAEVQTQVANAQAVVAEKTAAGTVTRKVYLGRELVAKIVERDNGFHLHYIENGRDIGGDVCKSLDECFDTLSNYCGF
jgi:cytidylate kinase